MNRLLWLVAAVVAVGAVPSTAAAKDVYGVAIAKDAHRRTIVAATPSGGVETLRVRRLGKVKLGQRFEATGRTLSDRTIAASRVRLLGRARQVRFRATVVKLNRSQGRLILSAGQSVFGVKLRSPERTLTSSGGDGLQAGDKIVCEAKVAPNGLATEAGHLTEIGHTDKVELEGIYLFANDGGIAIAVVHRGLVHVQVPKGFELPKLAAGDEVALLVAIESNGSFTLVRIKNEDGEVEPHPQPTELFVTGVISQLRVDGLSVKPEGDKPPASCKVPAGFSLSDFAVGDRVAMKCRLDGERYVLVALKSEHAYIGPTPPSPVGPTPPSPDVALTGAITELGETFVRVQPDSDGPSVRCDAPAGVSFAGFAVGDKVAMKCRLDGGRYVVVAVKSDHASIPASSELWATGVLTEKGSTFVRVQPDGDSPSVRCDFAEGVDLHAIAVGDRVLMLCYLRDGHYMLAKLQSETAIVYVDK